MHFYIYLWSRSHDGVGSAQPPSVSRRRRYNAYSSADRIYTARRCSHSYIIVTRYPSYMNQCEHDARGLTLERIVAFISANAAKSGTPSTGGRNHACWLIIRVNPRSRRSRIRSKSINVGYPPSYCDLHLLQKVISVFPKIIKSLRVTPWPGGYMDPSFHTVKKSNWDNAASFLVKKKKESSQGVHSA